MLSSSVERELCRLSAVDAAARLIGSDLIRVVNGARLSGRIVETEAYDQSDPASHSYNGQSKRALVMFGPAGRAYVYFTYGMHYCVNVVSGQIGEGSAVLIRSVEPLQGIDSMEINRGAHSVYGLCSGPARLTQAMAIGAEFNGHDLSSGLLRLKLNPRLPDSSINWSVRIGVNETVGEERKWRATLKGSKYLSRRE